MPGKKKETMEFANFKKLRENRGEGFFPDSVSDTWKLTMAPSTLNPYEKNDPNTNKPKEINTDSEDAMVFLNALQATWPPHGTQVDFKMVMAIRNAQAHAKDIEGKNWKDGGIGDNPKYMDELVKCLDSIFGKRHLNQTPHPWASDFKDLKDF